MNTDSRMVAKLLLLTSLLLMLSASSIAEVGATSLGLRCAGIVIDPDDGGPSSIWRRIRLDSGPLALQPAGEARGDLEPDIRLNPTTGRPEAVWPYWDGSDYEIAWSTFDGTVWSEVLLLTDNALDDLEPAIAFDALGTLGIAFRRTSAPARIWYLEHDIEHGWSPEIAVSEGSASTTSPSIAFFELKARVGYVASPTSQVVVAFGGGDGGDPWPTFSPELVALTTNTADLQQETLVVGGTLYTVWVNDSLQLAFSRYAGGQWQVAEYEPYMDGDEIPLAKIRVKGRVLH